MITSELNQKIVDSILLLKKAEAIAKMYDPEHGYYLAFSGGKDSQALYHLAWLAGVKFQAHMNLTSVDPPEVLRFVKKQYPDVILHKPKDSIYHIAVKKGILPSQKIRWCCAEFKENAGAGKVTLLGIRREESTRRAKRNEVEVSSRAFSGTIEEFETFRKLRMANKRIKKIELPPSVANPDGITTESVVGCITGKESILISPIINWTEKDVWDFLNDFVKVPHCSLYDRGHKRIGCILCPMSSIKQKRKDIEEYPHAKACWIRAIKEIRGGGGYKQTNLPDGHRPEGNRLEFYGKFDPDKSQLWGGIPNAGFLDRPSGESAGGPDKEDQIAENIFDWWISGKSYKRWYADRFLQQQFKFEEQ